MTGLLDLADETSVALTTFRRSGEAVTSSVWVAREGDALVVSLPARGGRIARIAVDPRVLVSSGDGAEQFEAVADLVVDDAQRSRIRHAFEVKYGVRLNGMRLLRRLLSRPRRRSALVRITSV